MKKLIKTSISLFAVFALVITFSLQQVSAADKIRWKVIQIIKSPITGPKGNVEYLLYASK